MAITVRRGKILPFLTKIVTFIYLFNHKISGGWGKTSLPYIWFYSFLVTHPNFMKLGDLFFVFIWDQYSRFFSKFETIFVVLALSHDRELLFEIMNIYWNYWNVLASVSFKLMQYKVLKFALLFYLIVEIN